ncbi:MAG: VanZ family protein [Pseudomonadota bacterium]
MLAVAAAVAIAFFSLTPAGDSAMGHLSIFKGLAKLFFDDWSQVDKFGHFLAYTVLGALSAFGVRLIGKTAIVFTILAVSITLYGGLLEILQGFFPERSRSLADLFANMLGVLTGFGLAELAHMVLKRYKI